MGTNDSIAWTGPWLGTTMFFSHFDAATNRTLVENAGLEIARRSSARTQNGETVRFLWVLARRH